MVDVKEIKLVKLTPFTGCQLQYMEFWALLQL